MMWISELGNVHEQSLIMYFKGGEHAGHVRNMNIGRLKDVLV